MLPILTATLAATLVVAPVATQATLQVTDTNGVVIVSPERAQQNLIVRDFDSLILNGYITIQGN